MSNASNKWSQTYEEVVQLLQEETYLGKEVC